MHMDLLDVFCDGTASSRGGTRPSRGPTYRMASSDPPKKGRRRTARAGGAWAAHDFDRNEQLSGFAPTAQSRGYEPGQDYRKHQSSSRTGQARPLGRPRFPQRPTRESRGRAETTLSLSCTEVLEHRTR